MKWMGSRLRNGQVGLTMLNLPCYAGSHLQYDTIHHHAYGAGLTPGLPFFFRHLPMRMR